MKQLIKYLLNIIKPYRTRRSLKLNFNKYHILQEITSLQILQTELSDKEAYKIAFIIPNMPKFSGGHTSILRLGTYLSIFGHDVYYITIDDTSVDRLKENAKVNLPSYKGVFRSINDLEDNYDIGIATAWITAYYLNKFQNNFKQKVYFIQGYEPGFFPEGDRYYLAQNTYKMNLQMISIGHWNKKRIENINGNLYVDYIAFPFEHFEYPITPRHISIDKTLKLAVYFRKDDPRAPTLLLQSLDLLQKNMKIIDRKLEVFFFGLPKVITLPIGENLGQLNTIELRNLYQRCHIGIAASFSNISLVPYEMIASGLPVCDFIDGSAPDFFDDTSMIFCESTPQDFSDKLMQYMKNTDTLNTLLKNAQRSIQENTWESSAKQFCSHLKIPSYKKKYGTLNENT